MRAVEQQVNAIQEMAKASENINEMSQSISAAEEMSASTGQLPGMAQQLQAMVARFKIDRDRHGRSMRPGSTEHEGAARPGRGVSGGCPTGYRQDGRETGITLKKEAA
jgi:hypothetical protein